MLGGKCIDRQYRQTVYRGNLTSLLCLIPSGLISRYLLIPVYGASLGCDSRTGHFMNKEGMSYRRGQRVIAETGVNAWLQGHVVPCFPASRTYTTSPNQTSVLHCYIYAEILLYFILARPICIVPYTFMSFVHSCVWQLLLKNEDEMMMTVLPNRTDSAS